jgi:hypothetical protein
LALLVSSVLDNFEVDAKFRAPCIVVYDNRTPKEFILFLLDYAAPKVLVCSTIEEVETIRLDFKDA